MCKYQVYTTFYSLKNNITCKIVVINKLLFRKAKSWERDRRNRLNTYFKNLSDLLPPHLEGRKRSKTDILIHASAYIKDLQSGTEPHGKAYEVQSK